MKKLEFSDIVAILQDSFEEDLMQHVEDNEFYPGELVTEDPLAAYLMIKLYDSFDPDATNEFKIDSFFSTLEDIRDVIAGIEGSLENWEELIDAGENE